MTLPGLNSDNRDNIHQWETITTPGSTPGLEVNGTNFTFVDVVGGTNPNVTISHQGSLDGTNWFELEAHSYNTHGTQAKFYMGRPMRYVRTSVSNINSDETVTPYVMVN